MIYYKALSILHNSDYVREEMRIIDCFKKFAPDSRGWVLFRYSELMQSEYNKWTFTNVAPEYRWMKRLIDKESRATINTTFQTFPSAKKKAYENSPAWTCYEGVILNLVEEGYLWLNEERTAAYPTERMFEDNREL